MGRRRASKSDSIGLALGILFAIIAWPFFWLHSHFGWFGVISLVVLLVGLFFLWANKSAIDAAVVEPSVSTQNMVERVGTFDNDKTWSKSLTNADKVSGNAIKAIVAPHNPQPAGGISLSDFSEVVAKHFAICLTDQTPPDNDSYWINATHVNSYQSLFLGQLQQLVQYAKTEPLTSDIWMDLQYVHASMDYGFINETAQGLLNGFVEMVGNETAEQESEQSDESVSYVMREGKRMPADKVFEAWVSGDLTKMLAVINVKANLIDRHHLLQRIVDETYKNRKQDVEMRRLCVEVAQTHLDEFPLIMKAFKKDRGALPHVNTFQHYATVLTEDGKFDAAIAVCQLAIKYGLHDGTQSGYEGRINRIISKKSRTSSMK